MGDQELIKKIKQKKEFSELAEKDVEIAYSCFGKRQTSEEEKIRLTRELLHKSFGVFGNRKIFSAKNKTLEWFLKKQLSTRERFEFYEEIYKRVLNGFEGNISIFDLGAGINGFSYSYFKKLGFNVDYYAVESIGQFVNLMNFYFEKEKINGKAFHLSLFETEKIKDIIKSASKKKPKIIFLFKVLDSLEYLKNDSSKELLLELKDVSDRIIVSFPTESIVKRRKFRAKRTWILDFIQDNFRVLDDFNIIGERFIVFENK